jgi:pyruvate ferredoxin oxidoreductase alpha subunit
MYTDLAAGLSLYTSNLPYMANIVAGIAGVNVTSDDFYGMVKSFIDSIEEGRLTRNYFAWVKVRR